MIPLDSMGVQVTTCPRSPWGGVNTVDVKQSKAMRAQLSPRVYGEVPTMAHGGYQSWGSHWLYCHL